MTAPESSDSDDHAWLCDCGHYEESEFCCSLCGNEPPWGCDCDNHDWDEDPGWEEYEYP